MEVTLEEMLAAREARSFRQMELNRQWGMTIISFSMNIPGPVKDAPIIRRGFQEGCAKIAYHIPSDKIKYKKIIREKTGCEAVYVVDMEPIAVKKITTAVEDEGRLGRLFDMDVLDQNLNKLDREEVGGKSRDCIVCGAPGRGCASRRIHSVAELQHATNQILEMHFMEADVKRIGSMAVQALLDEVATTPKPGLVDRRNSGSHTDMDIFTFQASASALAPYFSECVRIGQNTMNLSAEETFYALRSAGICAEQEMFRATGGVNTHKGAVFTIGILCGAAGRLWSDCDSWHEENLFAEVAAMTKEAMERDLARRGADTAGMRLYNEMGIRGIRGEVAEGLPSIRDFGLPVYRNCLDKGMDQNRAGAITLLNLIVSVVDTNMIKRGGMDGAMAAIRKTAQMLLKNDSPEQEEIESLDDWFIERNLSPGGCADLLAAVYFIQGLTKENRGGQYE